MTQRTSRVEAGVLYLADPRMERTVEVGSGEWFAWLSEPTTRSFILRGPHGNLTIRKERRQRGGDYWTAYRRVEKRLRKAYLGKSPRLTAARLEAADRLLAAQPTQPALDVAPPSAAAERRLAAPDDATAPQQRHPPLLVTKLAAPPPRPGRIRRARLTGWLTAHLGCSVFLLTAPAGFGKTTLLAEWMETPAVRGLPFAWVALDEGDNDPAQFWSYVVAALRTVLPDLPLDTLTLLRSPGLASPSLVAATLVNAVAAVPRDVALVLDDYHAITSQAIHDGLTFLLDHLPAHLRVILTSRAEPPLPLARLGARGRLARLDAADLRCTPRESAAFLRRGMGLRLAPAAEAMLADRTEGWLAGLQLAALALRDHDATPDALATLRSGARFVESFLTDEVLQRQPAAIQRFLLDTSPLDELTGPLCDAVTGGHGGAAMLRRLAAANLFVVPLDERGETYRYHQLFAEVLRSRLRQAFPGREAVLQRRAAGWYARHGRCAEAIRHALAAGDSALAADLMNDVAFPMMWEHGEIATVHGWLTALPEPLVAARPNLAVAYAYTCLLTHHNDDAERWIVALASAPPHPNDAHRLRGAIAFIRVHLSLRRGDLAGSAALAQEALDHLSPDAGAARAEVTLALGMAHYRRGDLAAASGAFAAAVRLSRHARNRFLTSLALSHLTVVALAGGNLRQAERWCREAIRLAHTIPGAPPAPYAGLAYHFMAELLYEWNELDEALRHAEEAARLFERMGDTAQLIFLYELLLRLHVARGDMAAGRVVFEALRDLHSPALHSDIWQAVLEARWHLLEGDVAAAGLWAPTFFPASAGAPGASVPNETLIEFESATLARLRLAQGRYDEALRIVEYLEYLRPAAGRAGKTERIIELRTLEALAWHGAGDTARALDALRCALELAQPGWHIRLFVDFGEPMAALLRRACAHGIAPAYVRHLLAAFQAPRRDDALTPQELRILQLLAAGSSNAAVAHHLMVSASTVKTHLYHIYQKLGAHNRAHAVVLARERGLLTAP